MNLLRGNSDAVSVVDGYVTIEVLPLVQAALSELQSVGLLPDGVQIPDLTTSEAPSVLSSGCPRRSGSRCRPTSARSA